MIAGDLHESLRAVAAVTNVARDPWWIIGSAAVALHGVAPITVADIDVLLGIDDAQRILRAVGLPPAPGSGHPKFRSDVFGTWRTPRVPVDFMAGFHLRDGDRWVPVQPATRQAIDVGDAVVYVPERDELRRIIESFGRPKDFERALLLAALR